MRRTLCKSANTRTGESHMMPRELQSTPLAKMLAPRSTASPQTLLGNINIIIV